MLVIRERFYAHPVCVCVYIYIYIYIYETDKANKNVSDLNV